MMVVNHPLANLSLATCWPLQHILTLYLASGVSGTKPHFEKSITGTNGLAYRQAYKHGRGVAHLLTGSNIASGYRLCRPPHPGDPQSGRDTSLGKPGVNVDLMVLRNTCGLIVASYGTTPPLAQSQLIWTEKLHVKVHSDAVNATCHHC